MPGHVSYAVQKNEIAAKSSFLHRHDATRFVNFSTAAGLPVHVCGLQPASGVTAGSVKSPSLLRNQCLFSRQGETVGPSRRDFVAENPSSVNSGTVTGLIASLVF